MNEFIEKLIGRLEEINYTDYGSFGSYESHVAVRNCLRDVKNIVNQLAEEYKHCIKSSCSNCEVYDKEKHYCPKWCEVIKHTTSELAEEYENDFCEWKIVSDRDIHREYKPMCSEDGFIEITGYFDYEFCPYCGKKIKVASYQPKGE